MQGTQGIKKHKPEKIAASFAKIGVPYRMSWLRRAALFFGKVEPLLRYLRSAARKPASIGHLRRGALKSL